jgi:hypothetical protein
MHSFRSAHLQSAAFFQTVIPEAIPEAIPNGNQDFEIVKSGSPIEALGDDRRFAPNAYGPLSRRKLG